MAFPAVYVPVTSTSRTRSLFSESLGTPSLESSLSFIPSQSLRAVAITGSEVRVKSCCAKANPRPLEVGVTRAKPAFADMVDDYNWLQ